MIGNHLVHDMVGNQPGGLQRSVRLLELGPTPLESRVVIYHANISILIVISSANYTWNTFLRTLLPCAFFLSLPATSSAEREKAITVAEHLAHSLHCYSPKYDDADEYYHHNIVRWFILKDN